MKKQILILCFIIGILQLFNSCTKNQRTRSWGASEEMSLKPNEILINITWKGEDMWVLTEDTNTHIKYFRESSSWGIWNGEVIIKNK